MFGRYCFSEWPFAASGTDNRVFLNGVAAVIVSFQYTIFTATAEFGTRPTDALASQSFFGTLQLPLNFKRSILGSEIGIFATGDGALNIDNTDAAYDFLIQQYAFDGRAIVVKVGREITNANTESYDDYFAIFSGTAADAQVDEAAVSLVLRDNGYKLNVPAQPNLYLGTGDKEGGDDLAQKRKPRAFGYVANVSPPLVVPSLLIYQVNDGPVQDITAVYDRGSALTQGTDYATYALLAAASVTGGFYGTCLAEGFLKLGSSPAGTVTADVSGDASGAGFISRTDEIVRRILVSSTVLIDSTDLYLSAFAAVASAQPAAVGYWMPPDDTASVSDVVANLMGGIGGWGGFRRDGRFEVAIFVAPTGTPAAIVDNNDIDAIKREPLPSGLSPPPWRQRVAYGRNWTTQTDLAGSVSATRRAFVAEPFRVAEASDNDIRTDHPFAQDPQPVAAFFANQADAQTEADRRLALYRGGRALYRMSLPIVALGWNLGEVMRVTYPRFDLTVGRLLTIVEMTENLSAQNGNKIEVVGYG
jgi:hypothetical protein